MRASGFTTRRFAAAAGHVMRRLRRAASNVRISGRGKVRVGDASARNVITSMCRRGRLRRCWKKPASIWKRRVCRASASLETSPRYKGVVTPLSASGGLRLPWPSSGRSLACNSPAGSVCRVAELEGIEICPRLTDRREQVTSLFATSNPARTSRHPWRQTS